jgi:ferredoxin
MVDTWTPLFDLSDAEKNTKMTEAAEPRISSVIDQVAKRIAGDFNDHKLPRFIAAPFYAQYRNGKATRDFTVGDSCIGCGLCSHTCPVQAIEMRDGKPAWTKERCAVWPRMPPPLSGIRHTVREENEKPRPIRQSECAAVTRRSGDESRSAVQEKRWSDGRI